MSISVYERLTLPSQRTGLSPFCVFLCFFVAIIPRLFHLCPLPGAVFICGCKLFLTSVPQCPSGGRGEPIFAGIILIRIKLFAMFRCR